MRAGCSFLNDDDDDDDDDSALTYLNQIRSKVVDIYFVKKALAQKCQHDLTKEIICLQEFKEYIKKLDTKLRLHK